MPADDDGKRAAPPHNATGSERTTFDLLVVGGGLVGTAVAWGAARRGATVCLIDADTEASHASSGNFGLVWVQAKGLGTPEYADLSKRSAEAWTAFGAALKDETGVDTAYRQTGGLKIALDDAEADRLAAELTRMHNQPGAGASGTRMVDRRELAEMLPGVGPDAVAARYCPVDGHADPLALRQALLKALVARPGIEVLRARVDAVRPLLGGGFEAWAGGERRRGQRVVLTAGLNAPALAGGLGLSAPVRPQRGQILVTERLPRFLDMACHNVRQTADGTVMLGDSKEDVGFDDGVTATAAHAIVQRAARTFPALHRARVVRQWGALRVMTPDGLPLYAESRAHPGAALLTCHSGVTLAAAHAGEVAEALLSDTLEERYPAFTAARFGVAA